MSSFTAFISTLTVRGLPEPGFRSMDLSLSMTEIHLFRVRLFQPLFGKSLIKAAALYPLLTLNSLTRILSSLDIGGIFLSRKEVARQNGVSCQPKPAY